MFDNVLTLHLLGATASARMTMAMRLCTTAAGLIAVLTQPLWPAFVEAESVGDRKWAMSTLCRGTFFVAIMASIGGFLIVSFGGPVLAWWLGSDIEIRSDLLWATALWIIVLCTPRVAALLLTSALLLRYQLIAATAALVLATALKFVLAGHYGAAGVLAATPLSWLIIMWPAYTGVTVWWRSRKSMNTKIHVLEV